MSGDHDSKKETDKIQESRQEKEILQNPDAHEARIADKATFREIEQQNKNRWESEQGIFAIVDDEEVVASKLVTEQSGTRLTAKDDSQQLEPVLGYQVEQRGSKILIKFGISNTEHDENLTTDQIRALAGENKVAQAGEQMLDALDAMSPDDKKDALRESIKRDISKTILAGSQSKYRTDIYEAGTFKAIQPEDSHVENKYGAESGATTHQSVFEEISKLPIDQQVQIIGTAVNASREELVHQGEEVWDGTQRGVNKGVMGLIQDFEDLANSLGRVWQFSEDVMTNNPRACETAAQAGETIGRTIVSGVKLWQVTEAYLGEVGATGDYTKPFKDLSNLALEIDRRWEMLSPAEKAELSSELFVKIAVPGAIGKLAKSAKLVDRLEEFTDAVRKLGPEDRDAFCHKLGQLLDDFFKPPERLQPAMATAGGHGQIRRTQKDDNALFSKRRPSDHPDEFDRKPHSHDSKEWHPFERLLINKHESPDVVKQHHENACVSACGQMLTDGKLEQRALHDELMENFHPQMRKPNSTFDIKWLETELKQIDETWSFKSFSPFNEERLMELLNSGKSWATEIKAYGKQGHAVVIDGLSEHGNIIIRDPEGFKYEMRVKDFINECWSGRSVVRG